MQMTLPYWHHLHWLFAICYFTVSSLPCQGACCSMLQRSSSFTLAHNLVLALLVATVVKCGVRPMFVNVGIVAI